MVEGDCSCSFDSALYSVPLPEQPHSDFAFHLLSLYSVPVVPCVSCLIPSEFPWPLPPRAGSSPWHAHF